MTGSLQLEEPVHTSWSRFYTVNYRALAGNYQISNMKRPGRDSNWQPQEVEWNHSNRYTTEPPDSALKNLLQVTTNVLTSGQNGNQTPRLERHEAWNLII